MSGIKYFDNLSNVFEMFDEVFGGAQQSSDVFSKLSDVYYGSSYPCDIYVEGGNVIFEFAVAGIKEEDIELDFKDDYLIFSIGKNKKSENAEEKKYIYKGLRKSSTTLKYFVPGSKFDHSKAEAALLDGILRVKVPQNPDAAPKRILITKK